MPGSELPVSDATLQRLRQLLRPDFDASVRAAAAAAAALYQISGAPSKTTDSCRVERAATNQTVTNGIEVACTFDTTAWDTHSMARSNGIEIITTGYYVVVGQVLWAASAAGVRQIRVATASEWGRSAISPAATGGTVHAAPAVALLSAGDLLELPCAQTSGGNLDIQAAVLGSRALTFLSAHLLSI